MTLTEILFWAAAGFLAWTYAGYPLAIFLVGTVRRLRIRPEVAEHAPSVSVILVPRDRDALVERLGNQKKMLARGRERLEECVRLAPRHETAWRKLGDAMKDARKNAKATKAYKQHLKVNPDTEDRDYVCDMLKDLGSSCS